MAKRIITSVVGLVLFFGVLFMGNAVFSAAVFIVSAIMLHEYYRSVGASVLCRAVGYVSAALIFACRYFGFDLYIGIILSICAFLLAMVSCHGKQNFKEVFASGFGTLFIALFMNTLIMNMEIYGVFGVFTVFLCAWMTDTGAYFCGRFFGRHKLAPEISPKKTVEGSIGGIITAVLACVIYLFAVNRTEAISGGDMEYIAIIVLAVVASVFSQLGDLITSAVKRDCGVKDFGNILPGHGGLLDRFDSVLFLSPFVYFLLLVLS